MLKFGYPDYQAHKAQHEKFIANFQELKKELPKLEGGSKPGSYDLSVKTNRLWLTGYSTISPRSTNALACF